MMPYKDGKTDCTIRCFGCGNVSCRRASKSLLASSLKIQVYSTNAPTENVRCIRDSYIGYSCKCVVVDTECKCCRMILGYRVLQPCELCISARNSKHTWIFDTSTVISTAVRECSDACTSASSLCHEEGDSEVKIR
ncbi:hypothetical protein EHEL_071290 [Encephalitozoon hellem ATCC 50504]|uniref:Kinetochore protein MIS18 n=1 Tax=Encephalitozoon hellem TaxID=27973 RepID=A0A9Q9C3R0_ENCHE|nr:uncharacterized protein EHEL_071290 [Encephalitozoon hellem ATCC 50504]AFM98655.1 hypothetical protein EHEL_071290 [Encephalitozoon hellem ATCC 50504]UTX43604.1 kinetochore protein MIS18 [Encephalitozoon hellem]WEL39079.1 kinetochore protein MIS18 [Encephalitozoon hellem]|eukprot:XP_003887636.1 hypothetical protein EHEL_071290 [Encephalitozoon hellem ATCC 50504]